MGPSIYPHTYKLYIYSLARRSRKPEEQRSPLPIVHRKLPFLSRKKKARRTSRGQCHLLRRFAEVKVPPSHALINRERDFLRAETPCKSLACTFHYLSLWLWSKYMSARRGPLFLCTRIPALYAAASTLDRVLIMRVDAYN